jgi:hypothetical protein
MNAFKVTTNSKPVHPGRSWNMNFRIIEWFNDGLVGLYNMDSSGCVPAFQKIAKFGSGRH